MIMEFKFTFETEQEYMAAQRTGYIPDFDIVRVEVRNTGEAGSIDFPVKSREEYDKLLKRQELGNFEIIKVYQASHSYDIQDYD